MSMAGTVSSLVTMQAKSTAIKGYDSQAFLNSDQCQAAPAACTLYQMFAVNKSASLTLWIMVFDKATAPGGSDIPILPPIPIASNQVMSNVVNDYLVAGITLAHGLWWMASTSPTTPTADTTSSVWFNARYS